MDSGKLVKIEQLPVQGTYDQEQILAVLSRIACTPGLLDRLIRCADRMPELERQLGHFEDRCRSTVSRCESLELIAGAYLCPEQVSFSRRTRDEFSNRSQVKLHKVEQDFGGEGSLAFRHSGGQAGIVNRHHFRIGAGPEDVLHFGLADVVGKAGLELVGVSHRQGIHRVQDADGFRDGVKDDVIADTAGKREEDNGKYYKPHG